MRTITVHAAESVAPELIGQIEKTFHDCYTLADLLAWAARQSPRVHIAEIVTQDEYTHDVVLPYASSYLSFDTT